MLSSKGRYQLECDKPLCNGKNWHVELPTPSGGEGVKMPIFPFSCNNIGAVQNFYLQEVAVQ